MPISFEKNADYLSLTSQSNRVRGDKCGLPDYPSRRVWLHLAVTDASSRTVFELGAVNSEGAIAGNENEESRRFIGCYKSVTSSSSIALARADAVVR